MAVNDAHVMKAWRQSLGAVGKLDFMADGDGDYARALGLSVPMAGMGMRLRRFSALIVDGRVTALNFEPEGSKGIVFTGAATMLTELGAREPA